MVFEGKEKATKAENPISSKCQESSLVAVMFYCTCAVNPVGGLGTLPACWVS